MASEQTPQQIAPIGVVICNTVPPLLCQTSAIDTGNSDIIDMGGSTPPSTLGSATEDILSQRKAKRKNHRGGKRNKKSKKKRAGTGDAEKSDVHVLEEDLDAHRQETALELQSENFPVVKDEVLSSRGKGKEDTTPAKLPAEGHAIYREESAKTDVGDGVSQTGDSDAAIIKSSNETIFLEEIDTAIHMNDDRTIAHETVPEAADTKETFPLTAREGAAITVEKPKIAASVAEDERVIAGKKDPVVVSPSKYEIKPAPGKGLGMFSSDMIQRGTRILEEEALVMVSGMFYSAVLPVFAALEPEKKAIFMKLAGAEDTEEVENLAWYLSEAETDVDPSARNPIRYKDQAEVQLIFRSNSFDMTPHTSGIFPVASRMNHSCIPNVYHTWNSNINRLTVHALKNITPGEELLTTYIPAVLTLEQRNDEEHLGNYGFTCTCPACNPKSKFFKESVFRRASAIAIEEQLASYFAFGSLRDSFGLVTGPLSCIEALRYAQLRVNLLMEEGIMNMDLVRWYVDQSRILLLVRKNTNSQYSIHETGDLALLCGEFEEAITCAKTAIWLTETCAGKDSPHMAVLRSQLIEAKQKVRPCSGSESMRVIAS
jgi:hypothetical protein